MARRTGGRAWAASRLGEELLFDQSLSRHLVDHVRHVFPRLVARCSARGHAILRGLPPKVVWLRLGNVTTVDIATVILDRNEAIERFATDEDEALLVLAGT